MHSTIEKPNLAFIVDIRNWAFDNVAKNLQKKLALHFNVQILYWEDYPSTQKFLKVIAQRSFQHVHFFFREHLKLILDNHGEEDKLIHTLVKATVTSHVPDYLYSSPSELAARLNVFEFLDGYFVTNADLERLYSSEPLIRKPDAVIYDWPAICVDPVPQADGKQDTIRLVWCGNSKWGEYAGHIDYKGLKNVVEPA